VFGLVSGRLQEPEEEEEEDGEWVGKMLGLWK